MQEDTLVVSFLCMCCLHDANQSFNSFQHCLEGDTVNYSGGEGGCKRLFENSGNTPQLYTTNRDQAFLDFDNKHDPQQATLLL